MTPLEQARFFANAVVRHYRTGALCRGSHCNDLEDQMTDLTAITTPFGLLDAETQEALKAHGGPYEVFTGSRWETSVMSSHAGYMVYRVKPAPPKPRECWSYGAHLRDTLADAEKFRADVDASNPGNGYLSHPITKWIEVLE